MAKERASSTLHTMDAVEREFLLGQLHAATESRSSEARDLLSIFAIFWAAHSILLGALIQRGEFPSDLKVSIAVSLFGGAISIAWGLIQQRSWAYIDYYDKLTWNIENRLQVPAQFAISPKINLRLAQNYLHVRPKSKHVMQACPPLVLIFWLVIGVISTACA